MKCCVLVVFVLGLGAGCTPHHVAVRPRTADQLVGPFGPLIARTRVPELGAGGLDVRVWSVGVIRDDYRAGGVLTVPITVLVENRSELVTASFDPRSATIGLGPRGELSPIAPVASATEGASDVTAIPIEPGARRLFNLVFETRSNGDPRTIVPFVLELRFEYARREVTAVVTFVTDDDLTYTYYFGQPAYGYPSFGSPTYGYPYFGPSAASEDIR